MSQPAVTVHYESDPYVDRFLDDATLSRVTKQTPGRCAPRREEVTAGVDHG